MARYIDAENARIDADERGFDFWTTDADIDNVQKFLDEQPTVDVVEVIRCKDCKHYLNSTEKCGLIDTRLHFYETNKVWASDSFCSWGERSECDGECEKCKYSKELPVRYFYEEPKYTCTLFPEVEDNG